MKSTDNLRKDKYGFFNIILSEDDRIMLSKQISKAFEVKISIDDLFRAEKELSFILDNIKGRIACDIEDMIINYFMKYATALHFSSTKNLYHVEIGSLFGVSAIFAEYSLRKANQTNYQILIDPLNGYYGLLEDPFSGCKVNESTLRSNLDKFEINNFILISDYSNDSSVVESVKGYSIGSLFIDGDHSFVGILLDWYNYSSLLLTGGYILIDNYNDEYWPDVSLFVDEYVKNDPRFELVYEGGKSIVFNKINNQSISTPKEIPFSILDQITRNFEAGKNRLINNNVMLKKQAESEHQEINKLVFNVKSLEENLKKFNLHRKDEEESIKNHLKDINLLLKEMRFEKLSASFDEKQILLNNFSSIENYLRNIYESNNDQSSELRKLLEQEDEQFKVLQWLLNEELRAKLFSLQDKIMNIEDQLNSYSFDTVKEMIQQAIVKSNNDSLKIIESQLTQFKLSEGNDYYSKIEDSKTTIKANNITTKDEISELTPDGYKIQQLIDTLHYKNDKIDKLEGQISEKKRKISSLESSVSDLKKSYSWKIGQTIINPIAFFFRMIGVKKK